MTDNSVNSGSHSELREAIEAAIQIHDDGDGAPVGRVIDEVAPEFGIATALSRTHELYVRGDLYTTSDGRVRVTRRGVRADGGTVDEVVYVAGRNSGGPRVYHQSTECHHLQKAKNHYEKDPDILDPDAKPCGSCVGDRRVLTDGGTEETSSDWPPFDDRTVANWPTNTIVPDPKTAHPSDLLGRRVAIDFGSNVREGEIRQVKDHAVQGRWISAKPEQGGMILADPEEHAFEFVEGDDE